MDRDAPAGRAALTRDGRRARPDACGFAQGEEIRTEISAKFRREGVEAELTAAGFTWRWWTDAKRRFALSLAQAV